MNCLTELLDGQCQIEQLGRVNIGVSHVGLAKANKDVARQDLVVQHHGEDVLALVENATLWDGHIGKFENRSRHMFLFLSLFTLFFQYLQG